MLTFGSLFAGIGGFDLGLERAGMECRWQVEIDPYCQRVLARHWPSVKRYGDIRKCHGILAHATRLGWRGRGNGDEEGNGRALQIERSGAGKEQSLLAPVDLICGGFPCQPFSVAGKRGGKADDRYLWPEMLRVISEVRPAWVLGENVAGIIHMELDTVLADLEAEGYETQAFVIPACGVDAPHRRDRVWIIGHVDNTKRTGYMEQSRQVKAVENSNGKNNGLSEQAGQDVADTAGARLQKRGSPSLGRYEQESESERCRSSRAGAAYWLPEPDVGRVAHGLPSRVDRLRALGNAVVPSIVQVIAEYILKAEKENCNA